jgi:hypothetical protein
MEEERVILIMIKGAGFVPCIVITGTRFLFL